MSHQSESKELTGEIDNRRHKRTNLHYPAWVMAEADSPPCNCMLWDVSDTGGRLTIEKTSDIPELFVLVFSKDGDHPRKCHTVWRNELELGFKFLDQGATP